MINRLRSDQLIEDDPHGDWGVDDEARDDMAGVPTPTGEDESECSDPPSADAIDEAAELVDHENDPIPSGFVVALTAAKFRRLHFVGNCGRRPGEHYHTFEVFGDSPPDPLRYDKRCRQCFAEENGLGEAVAPGTMDGDSESSGSPTSSAS